jgi:CBS domain containing-hemolysin-like protein
VVLIFAELAPIFAARRYPEAMSMGGSGLVYLSAKLMTPAIWAISALARLVNWLVGGNEVKNEGFISRDELQIILEMRDQEPIATGEAEELNLLARNIFALRSKAAINAMVPLNKVRGLPSNSTIGHMRQILGTTNESFAPVFHRDPSSIVGIAFARDMLRIPDGQRVRDHARPPWFIPYGTGLLQILQQFRRNKQTVAVVLNDQGRAIGILTLDDVIDEIFGQIARSTKPVHAVTLDKIFPGDTTLREINAQFGVHLEAPEGETLAELIEHSLGHHPEVGESLMIDRFQLIVEESSLLEIKKVRVKTR